MHGMYNHSQLQREKEWSYEEDVDFWIACEIYEKKQIERNLMTIAIAMGK